VFAFVERQKGEHAIATLCRVLGVSTSGYYAWRKRPPSVRAQADAELAQRIRRIHGESRGTYGAPRIHAALRLQEGICCSRKRVARLMREQGLVGVHRRRPRGFTRRDPQATRAPDRVRRQFVALAANRLWVADITQHRTAEGWLYVAVVLDVFSRRVVGWSMADHLRADIVQQALEMALARRCPEPGLIHHSDHGCQYTAVAFGQRLQQAGILQSMGTVGDALDNAVAESFWASLQTELLDRGDWPNRQALRLAVFEYIEVFYNRRRRHSALGYLTPEEFERRCAAADESA